ncbi:ABC transporter permease [Oceanibium sediminis]|uniref:ABC transporter permease n=1 Tax=Oceanibium sediminis TaxID=2026339 RepID=UPI000DD499C8|nr:ABC transporter permease [Oceanibium sediminis]
MQVATPANRWLANATVSNLASLGVSLIATMLVVGLLAETVGRGGFEVLGAMISGAFGSWPAIVETIREATPIALCGLAFLIPFQAGFFNIGAQGQLQVGALVAVFITTTITLPAVLMIPIAMILAAVAGSLLMAPALVLKTHRGANEVTTTVMLNFVALEFVLMMVTGPMKEPGSFIAESVLIPEAYRLPGTDLHLGVFMTVVIALALAWILKRTVFGFRLAAVGGNRSAADALGIRSNMTLAKAVLGAGAIAGLAGGIQALGVVFQVAELWAKPWGFIGILAALMGRTPVGVLFAALFLAGLEIGGRNMQAMTGVPAALVYMMQALPVIFYLAIRSTHLYRTLIGRGERQ